MTCAITWFCGGKDITPRAARVSGKDCLRQLLATVENITNVKSYLVLFTNWSYTPA